MDGGFECWKDGVVEVSFHYGGVGVDELHVTFMRLGIRVQQCTHRFDA